MKKDLTQVIINAQSGDAEALNRLFNETYNDVYYFALKTVKDENTAYDITQETFIEVIRTMNTLREPAAFNSWLRMITYHQCTRYFKKKKDVLVDEDEEGATIFDTLQEDKTEFIPDEALDKSEFRQIIMSIIDSLSEDQRSAVLMYYFDELSVKQIAEIQKVSEGTVKSRLNYARKYIKAAVEKYEEEHRIKLHSGILPLLFWFFSSDMQLTPIPAFSSFGFGAAQGTAVHFAQSNGASRTAFENSSHTTAGNGMSEGARLGASGNDLSHGLPEGARTGAKAAAKSVAKTAVKKTGWALGTKITAGIAAVVLAGCAAVGVIALTGKENTPESEIAVVEKNNENKNGEVKDSTDGNIVNKEENITAETNPDVTEEPSDSEAETDSPEPSDLTASSDPEGVYVSSLDYNSIQGRWEKKMTFKEFAQASGGSMTALGEAISNAEFTKKMTIYFEFKSDKTAVSGIDPDSFMEIMPELIDAMVEYFCLPEVLGPNEGFDPEDYDAWFASIGTTAEQYKEDLRQEFNAKLNTPEGMQMIAGAETITEYTYEIEGNTVKVYEGSRKSDELELRDGKLWAKADDDMIGFTKH